MNLKTTIVARDDKTGSTRPIRDIEGNFGSGLPGGGQHIEIKSSELRDRETLIVEVELERGGELSPGLFATTERGTPQPLTLDPAVVQAQPVGEQPWTVLRAGVVDAVLFSTQEQMQMNPDMVASASLVGIQQEDGNVQIVKDISGTARVVDQDGWRAALGVYSPAATEEPGDAQ